jgi:hypothetical protein
LILNCLVVSFQANNAKYKALKAVNSELETQLLKSLARSETLSRQLQTSLRRKTASTDSLEAHGATGTQPNVGINIPGRQSAASSSSSSSPSQRSASWTSSSYLPASQQANRASGGAGSASPHVWSPLGGETTNTFPVPVGLPSISENQFRPSLSPGPGGLYDLEQTLTASSPPAAAF